MPRTLTINRITKQYTDGDRRIDVINDLSFELMSGESLAVTGPSGSGKSTLLNLLAGVLPVDKGELVLDVPGGAVCMHDASERERTAIRRQQIGYVYQFFNLVPTLTVLENVRLPARLNRRRDLDKRAAELLQNFGLADRTGVYPEVLSGGEQQRVPLHVRCFCHLRYSWRMNLRGTLISPILPRWPICYFKPHVRLASRW